MKVLIKKWVLGWFLGCVLVVSGCGNTEGDGIEIVPHPDQPPKQEHPQLKTACNDGIDNDGDGFTDWQSDLGCSHAGDTSEQAYERKLEDGFTTFEPPKSGIVLYVSEQGKDTNDGTSPQQPIHLEKAVKLLKDKQGAWILIKRGDRIRVNKSLRLRVSGASQSDRIVFAAYGNSNRPPVLFSDQPKKDHFFFLEGSNLAIIGIDFDSSLRDPKNSKFINANLTQGILYLSKGQEKNVLFENCRFLFGGLVIQGSRSVRTENIELRRNLISHAYSTKGHSSGAFIARVDGLLLEENIFDHNGWNIQQRAENPPNDQSDGQATMFNHNAYISSVHNIKIVNNYFLRAASMGLKMRSDETGKSKNIDISGNVFYEGEIGIGLGGNTSKRARFQNAQVSQNVFLNIGRARPTNRTLAWGLGLTGHKGLKVYQNHFLNYGSQKVRNTHGINIGGELEDAQIHQNFFYHIKQRSLMVSGKGIKNTMIERNIIHARHSKREPVAMYNETQSLLKLRNNIYRGESAKKLVFEIDKKKTGFNEWQKLKAVSGAQFENSPKYLDPNRSLATYLKDQFGRAGDEQVFIQKHLQAQTRLNWNSKYTAQYFVRYISDGFKVKK